MNKEYLWNLFKKFLSFFVSVKILLITATLYSVYYYTVHFAQLVFLGILTGEQFVTLFKTLFTTFGVVVGAALGVRGAIQIYAAKRSNKA